MLYQMLVAFFDEMDKTAAELKTQLLPHQERVVQRIEGQPGLVVAHGLGSGKTLSSIAAVVKLQPDRTQVLVPAALQANYKKEIKKHVSGQLLPVEVGSLQNAVAKQQVPQADFLIIDEAHRGRNPQSKTYQLLEGAQAKKRLLLTASPTYNRPSDVASLVNLAAGQRVLPMGKAFDDRYVAKPPSGLLGALPFTRTREGLQQTGELQTALSRWVDYHKSQGKDFPTVQQERYAVPMSKQQTRLHDAAWDQLSLVSKLRLRRGLPPDKKDLAAINQFQSQARQIASTERPYRKAGIPQEPTPKVQKAVDLFSAAAEKDPQHRALVYSNYLGTLRDYSEALRKREVPHAVFSGQQSLKQRKQIVEDYNQGKLKALLVSSAGGEGLDLKGTRQVQVLEPHWNTEKLKQVEGRAIRQGSHSHLPPAQRTVTVQRFESYPQGGLLGRRAGVEQVLNDMADNKKRLNQELIQLLERSHAR